MKVTNQAYVKLLPLTIRQDKKNYIAENDITGDFFEIPKVCVDAIELMQLGYSNDNIAETLENQYPQEVIDMVDFTGQLIELKLVESIDGIKIQQNLQNEKPKGFHGVPVKLGQLYFNKWMLSLYLLILVINLYIFFYRPNLFPHYQDIFISDSMVINTIAYAVITAIVVLHHEWGHILATRSYGLLTKLEISHRMFIVVFQTDLTPTWKLKPSQRLIPYLGGLCFDNILLFFVLIISIIFENNSVLQGILAIVIFDIIIKFIYQCSVFMKTDLYYVLENITGHYNLMESGKKWLGEKVPILPHNKDVVFDTELRFVRIYAIFYLLGIVLYLTLFGYYFIPQFMFVFDNIMPHLFDSMDSPKFWDALLFLLTMIGMLGLLFYSWTKKYILKKD